MVGRRRALLVPVLAALSGACRVYDSSLLLPGDAGATPSDASTPFGGGIGWWSGSGDQGCFSAGVPGDSKRPAPQAAADLDPVYLAIASVRLGGTDPDGAANKDAWKSLGFDLDSTCSASPTCAGAVSTSCKPLQPAADGNACRDNTFGKLAVLVETDETVARKYGLNESAFNCALCKGQYGFLIKVSGYNGTSTDDRVRVDLYPSPGLESGVNPEDCTTSNWSRTVCFQSSFPWKVQRSSMPAPAAGPDLPAATHFDENAYVRDGYVIVHLPPSTPFWFPASPGAAATSFPLVIEQGVVTGKLVQAADTTWSLEDGVLSGRSTSAALLDGFARIGLCQDDPFYDFIQTFLDSSLDILASGGSNPDTACNALSVGVGFTARQATAGALDEVVLPEPCTVSPDAGP